MVWNYRWFHCINITCNLSYPQQSRLFCPSNPQICPQFCIYRLFTRLLSRKCIISWQKQNRFCWAISLVSCIKLWFNWVSGFVFRSLPNRLLFRTYYHIALRVSVSSCRNWV